MSTIFNFWATFRVYIILGAIITALTALNIMQWRADIIEDTEAREAIKLATAQARLDIATQTLDNITNISAQAVKDNAELVKLRARLPLTVTKEITVYRDRVKRVEVPVCRSNEVQADALNKALHGRP